MADIGICSVCHQKIFKNQNYGSCPECQALFHEDCWTFYGKRCGVHGCQGHGELVIQQQTVLENIIPRRARIIEPPTHPFRLAGWLKKAGFILSGGISFGVIGVILSQLLSFSNLHLPTNLLFLTGFCGGAFLGWRNEEDEVPRMFFIMGGSLSGMGLYLLISRILILSDISVPGQKFYWLIMLLGALAGAFWQPAQGPLLRSGVGLLLAVYTLYGFNHLSLGDAYLESYDIVFILAVSWFSILPLIFHFSTQRRLASLVSALPGLVILNQINFGHGSVWQQVTLACLFFAFPVSGAINAHYQYHDDHRLSAHDWRPSWNDMGRLALNGFLAAGSLALILGLITIVGDWSVKGLDWELRMLSTLPRSEQFIELFGSEFPPISSFGLAILCIYGSIAAFGMLSRSGFFAFLQRLTRFFMLALLTGLSAFLLEQLLESIMYRWPIFAPFGPHFVSASPLLPFGTIALAVIYALAQANNRIPFYFSWLGVMLWSSQALAIGGLLALMGGLLGRGFSALIGVALTNHYPNGFLEMTWSDAIPVSLAYLGFSVGIGYMLIQWMKRRHGLILDIYWPITNRITEKFHNWVLPIIEAQVPWRLVMLYAILSAGGFWMLYTVLKHAF